MQIEHKDYIEQNIDLIQNNKWEEFFASAPKGIGAVLYRAGIDFMSIMNQVPDSAFSFSDYEGELIIPNGVIKIGYASFYRCSSLTGNLVIPDSVTTIRGSAFNGCNGFTGNLVIGSSVTEIGKYAFAGCDGFTGDLIIPDSVTEISDCVFQNCSGFSGDLLIGNGVKSIGNYAFYYCKRFTGNLVIGNSVTTIGGSAFSGCSEFTNIVLPQTVSEINKNAFSEMGHVTINYSGTKEQWKQLTAKKYIFKGTTYTCDCVDGTVKKLK